MTAIIYLHGLNKLTLMNEMYLLSKTPEMRLLP